MLMIMRDTPRRAVYLYFLKSFLSFQNFAKKKNAHKIFSFLKALLFIGEGTRAEVHMCIKECVYKQCRVFEGVPVSEKIAS